MKDLSAVIRLELEKRGLNSLSRAAKFLGVSSEILRRILNRDHIPKDRTLRIIADRLGLDLVGLILAAHREKVPDEMKSFLLSPVSSPFGEGKRISPLSQEMCDYLGKLMNPEEIQLIRKYRQLSTEGKIQMLGYLDYHFSLHRAALQRV